MAQTIQMTNEQLHALIEAVRQSAVAAAGNAAAASESSTAKTKGSFSNCTHRFGGARSHDEVEEFITNIVTYKELESISDENALKGISLLFYGIASTWWQGVRKEAKTWNDAIGLIREHFSPTKPAYQVYMEFFEKKQNDSVAIDTFVVEKRALLAQLPEGRHNEETELDFLYGLLNIKYRKHIPRQSIQTFRDLLEQGRIIEHNNQEDEAVSRARNAVPAVLIAAPTATSAVTRSRAVANAGKQMQMQKRPTTMTSERQHTQFSVYRDIIGIYNSHNNNNISINSVSRAHT